jgi:hypothetical protein
MEGEYAANGSGVQGKLNGPFHFSGAMAERLAVAVFPRQIRRSLLQ